MPYMGCVSFVVCTYCTRMYNGSRCPACGNPVVRSFSKTTADERQRWQNKEYFADPKREVRRRSKR